MADFFTDLTANPDSVDYELQESGPQKEVGRVGDREGDAGIVIRELQTGVLISPRDAFTVGTWFLQKAVEAGYTPETPPPEGVQ